MTKENNILIYGYGNPGREDDGLGPALIDLVEEWIIQGKNKNVHIDSNYQLNIEDAFNIRDYDVVIFADASVRDIEDFKITRVEPSDKIHYSMHAVSPSFIVHLCKKMYNHAPDTYLLHIKGYTFNLGEGISNKASKNLHLAFNFIKEVLSESEESVKKLADWSI